MRWINDRQHWGIIARSLHWGMAALIAIEVPAGLIMSRTYGARDPVRAAWQFWSSNVHHSAGLVLLLLVAIRFGWRRAGAVPEPDGSSATRRMARITHWLLYALLILIPLAGWAALSSLADTPQFAAHLWFFGTDGFGPHGFIPRIVPAVPWNSADVFRYGFFARCHVYLLYAGAALLTLHILAALRHHFVLHDGTLRRMLRG